MKSQTIGSDGSGGWSWLPALCRGCVQVLTLAMLLLVCMPSVISAATYYVRTDGNNANTGLADSSGGAWRTVQKAANTMVAGDTVIVGNGTFAEIVETKVSGSSGSPITFRGSGSTIIQSFGLDHQYNYVDNFQVNSGGVVYAGIRYTASNVRATRCYINNISAIPIRMVSGSGTMPAVSDWPTNVYIAHCTITNCHTAAKSIEFVGSYSIIESNYVTSCKQDFMNLWGGNNVVRYNTCTNILWDDVNAADPNHNDWLQIEDVGASGRYSTNNIFQGNLAINCVAALVQFQPNAATNSYHTLKFYNNVFINFSFNGSAGIPNCQWMNNVFYRCATVDGFNSPLTFYSGNSQFNSNPAIVKNNVFFACGYNPNASVFYTGGYSNFPNSADYNFVASRPSNAYASINGFAEPHGLNGGNPLFVDIDNGDARLAAGSPLINKGVDLSAYFNTDKSGAVRSGNWDIGAYEYTSSTNLPPPDTTAPQATLTSPSPGSTVAGSINLTATAADDAGGSGVANVAFLVDGVVAGTALASPYTLAWSSASVVNGNHTVQARARDVAGNQALSPTITVTVQNASSDTTPPSVTMTAPALNAVVSNNVSLAASATDNAGGSGIAGVTFLVDGVALATATSSPYTVAWNSSVATNGAHAIQARATDNAGNEALSTSVNITVSNGTVQPPTLMEGLVGWWKFEETSGTTAADFTGNGNSGLRVGPAAWGRGLMGACLMLDGTNGYVRVPSTPALEQVSNAVSVSAWVLINSNGPMQTIARKVLSESTNNYPYSAYDLVIVDNGTTFFPRMGVTRVDSTRGLAYGTGKPYGQWCHIAGTYDGALLVVYVNGVEEGSTPFTGDILQTGGPLCIGRYGEITESVRGQIDDFRIYKRALSFADIQLLSKQPAAVPGVRSVLP